MVNFGFNSASVLGIFLALAGAGLYLLRSIKPEVSRDHDIFFAAVGLLCGGILLWHGWRLDPILQFSQLLLSGTAIFFAVESIRLRGVAQEKVKSRTSYVDEEERTVKRRPVYRASLAKREAYDDYYPEEEEERVYRRRLRGTTARTQEDTEYEEETPPPPRRRTSVSSRDYEVSPPRRSPRENTEEYWEEDSPPRPSRRSGGRSTEEVRRSGSTRRRPKSTEELLSRVGSEYVDYEPIQPEGDEDKETSPPTPEDNNIDNTDY